MARKFCEKHRKYKGKKTPTNSCDGCAALYLFRHNVPRFPVKTSKIFKDKKKYQRKEKHPNK